MITTSNFMPGVRQTPYLLSFNQLCFDAVQKGLAVTVPA
jgi:hypothetical protein